MWCRMPLPNTPHITAHPCSNRRMSYGVLYLMVLYGLKLRKLFESSSLDLTEPILVLVWFSRTPEARPKLNPRPKNFDGLGQDSTIRYDHIRRLLDSAIRCAHSMCHSRSPLESFEQPLRETPSPAINKVMMRQLLTEFKST